MSTAKLWIVGCSIAHGVGVKLGERWGDIVANELNIDPIFLTSEGSSIEWAADQILQADINSGDIVLWGLTTPNRFMWYTDTGDVQHILNVYYQNHPQFHVDIKHLVDLNLAYKAVNYVKQVQNYLSKINSKYAIGYILPGLDDHKKIILDNLSDTPNFFVAHNPAIKNMSPAEFLSLSPPLNIFNDIGTDKIHPGPMQHRLYAEQFLKTISNNTTK